jgi:hypothetical protein
MFEDAGYVALTPGWPDDPDTAVEAKADPEVFARKGVGDIADYYEAIIRRCSSAPRTNRRLLRKAYCKRSSWVRRTGYTLG